MTTDAHTSTRAWGLWQTLGWTLLVGLLFVVLQVASVWLLVWAVPDLAAGFQPIEFEGYPSGLLLSVATVVTAPVCLAAVWWIVRQRAEDTRGYLAWQPAMTPGIPLRWFVHATLLIVVADVVTWLVGRPLVPEFMRATYASAGWKPLYWLAIVGVAPLFEEIFFRGFVFRGIERSRLGATGAVAVTALIWSLVHTQYDWFELGIVFAGGLYLGWVRWRTGSTRLTYALHVYWNLVAVVQVALVSGHSSPGGLAGWWFGGAVLS